MSSNIFSKQESFCDFEDSITSELLDLVYAVIAYIIGTVALLWLFLASAGFAPYAMTAFGPENAMIAFFINLALVSMFAIQHTIMARETFKTWWRKYLPQHLERATYVMISGLLMILTLLAWQAIPGTVWNISHPIMKFSIQAIATLGFIYILASSFITNHLELFGIRQAWIFANHQQYTPVEFNHHYMYRYSRHPMMAGLLVVFWATPDMSMTRFVLGLLMTLYVFIGIRYEERGLVRDFGETYNQYQKQTGMFYTFR